MSLKINYPSQIFIQAKTSFFGKALWNHILIQRLKVIYLLLLVLVFSLIASSIEHGFLRMAEEARYARMAERDRKNNPGADADHGFDRLFESVKSLGTSLSSYSPTSIHPTNSNLTYLLPVDFDKAGHEDGQAIRDTFAGNFPVPPAYQLLGKYHYLNSTECTQPFEGVVISLLSDQGPCDVNEHWEVLYYLSITGNQKNLLRQELADGKNPSFVFGAPTAPWVINIEPPTAFRKRGVISVMCPVAAVSVGGTLYPQSLVDPEKEKLKGLLSQLGEGVKAYNEAVTVYNNLPADQKTSETYAVMDLKRKELDTVKLQLLNQIRVVQTEDPMFDYKTLPNANYIK